MSTKITRGARRHLLALYTPPGTVTITARNRMRWPAARARQSLKKLERSLRKSGSPFIVTAGAASVYERLAADAHRDVSIALLSGAYP